MPQEREREKRESRLFFLTHSSSLDYGGEVSRALPPPPPMLYNTYDDMCPAAVPTKGGKYKNKPRHLSAYNRSSHLARNNEHHDM